MVKYIVDWRGNIMKEETRKELADTLNNIKIDDPGIKTDLMLQLVWDKYRLHGEDCTHDYALRSIKPRTKGKEVCMCLDCGKYVNPEECQTILDVDKKYFHGMDGIRIAYIDYLLAFDSEKAIEYMSEVCEQSGIKLLRTRGNFRR
jgi:hypothetical protein